MHLLTSSTLRVVPAVLAAALVATAGLVQAQPAAPAPSTDASSILRRDTGIDASGSYRQELQACRSGRTQQAQETCLEEARNAHAARQQGVLHQQGENYTANALARCEPLTGEYRTACEARVMGFGSSTGTVAGGGVLRQVETVVLPPGAERVHVHAQTPNPVLLAPSPARP